MNLSFLVHWTLPCPLHYLSNSFWTHQSLPHARRMAHLQRHFIFDAWRPLALNLSAIIFDALHPLASNFPPIASLALLAALHHDRPSDIVLAIPQHCGLLNVAMLFNLVATPYSCYMRNCDELPESSQRAPRELPELP